MYERIDLDTKDEGALAPVLEAASQGKNILVTGCEQTGKTTLLLRLAEIAPDPSRTFVATEPDEDAVKQAYERGYQILVDAYGRDTETTLRRTRLTPSTFDIIVGCRRPYIRIDDKADARLEKKAKRSAVILAAAIVAFGIIFAFAGGYISAAIKTTFGAT